MTGFHLGCATKGGGTRDRPSPPVPKPNALVDAVDSRQGFGIKSYLHHFYQSPTVEDIEHGAWYLLPPPSAQRRGLFFCRIFTLIGLLLLIGGACAIVIGYTWPHENMINSAARVAFYTDDDGTIYLPSDKLQEILQDPMRQWKTAGFCIFSAGAVLLAFSLIVPTCAQFVGGHHLATFASEDNSPNEPPVRIYPGAPGLSGGPVPVMEEFAKVQPGEHEKPTTEDLLSR